MFHLGRAGGYAIVPGKDTIETFHATPPCLEQKSFLAKFDYLARA